MVVDVIPHGESTCKEEFVKHKTQNIQSSCYANGNGAPTKMCADISDGNVLSCERAYVKYINKKKKGLKDSDRFVFLDFFSINYISFSGLQLVDLSLLRS